MNTDPGRPLSARALLAELDALAAGVPDALATALDAARYALARALAAVPADVAAVRAAMAAGAALRARLAPPEPPAPQRAA